jgi:phosphoribosyl-ATP pyrophosphohydrolase/phosphoribosyl-AMP cyclohydrolase
MSDTGFIAELEQIVLQRLREAPEGSYTARLAAKGIRGIAQKVGEEGVELALAGVVQDDAAVVDEAADLLFHMLVLLAERGIPLARVVAALEERHRERGVR